MRVHVADIHSSISGGPCYYESDYDGSVFHTFRNKNSETYCTCGLFQFHQLQQSTVNIDEVRDQIEKLKVDTFRPVDEFTSEEQATFSKLLEKFARMVYQNSLKHGFYEEIEEIRTHVPEHLKEYFQTLVDGQKIALQHSELSEELESVRHNRYERDKHCPEFFNTEIEYCDLLIRVLDSMVYNNLRIAEPLFAKHNFNVKREYKHGKKF